MKQKSTSIELTWDEVRDATHYLVYYAKDGKWIITSSFLDKNTYKITGLKAGTKYTYAVKAYKRTESEIKRAHTFIKGTYMTAPALPSIAKTGRGYTSLKLNWKAGAGTTGYRVFIEKGGKWTQLVKATKAKTYTVKGLKSGQKYRPT